MAQGVVIRFKADSNEYDAKLKRSIEQMKSMDEQAKKLHGTIDRTDQGYVKFVQSLGQMDTKARSAKGSISEMTSAFTELSLLYKRLSDSEKASPLGAALSQSLDQLKGRIKSAKADLAGVEQQLSGGMGGGINLGGNLDLSQFKELGGIFQDLGGKLGAPSDMLGKLPNLLKGASSGFGSLGGSAASAGMKMAASLGPVSAAVAVLVAEIKLLTDAFKRNDEAMNGAMSILAPFKALWENFERLFDDIVSIFVDVRNNLQGVTGSFDYFQQMLTPVTALITLWRTEFAITGTIIRDVTKGIGWLGEKIQYLVMESALGQWLKSMKDELSNFFSYIDTLIQKVANTNIGKTMGLDKLYNDLKGIFTSQSDLTTANRQIIQQTDELNNLRRTNQEQNAQAEQEIARLRAEASKKDKYSATERVKMLEQAGELEKQIMQRNVDQKKKELALIQLENSLTHTGEAGLDKESAAKVAVTQAETSYYNGVRTIERGLQTAKNEEKGQDASGKELTLLEQRDQQIQEVTAHIQEMKDVLASTADDSTKAWATGQLEKFEKELDNLNGKAAETKKAMEITGPSGYSQEGISALRSEIQGGQKSMQMGSQEYMVEASRLVDLTTFENILKTAVQRGVTLDPALLESAFEKIDLGVDVKPEEWQNLVDTINEQVNELNPDPVKLDVQTGAVTTAAKNATDNAKSTADAWQNAVAAVNNVGSALQQIEDPAAKVSGIVMQAIANVALGFAQASASAATGAAGVFGWIAAATAGVATMVSTIAAIKSATSGGFANGGIVPGNSFSGDNLRTSDYGINAGELILNRAQQGAIAGQLNSNPMGNLRLSTEISGTNLRIVMNNDNRARGGQRGFYSEIH